MEGKGENMRNIVGKLTYDQKKILGRGNFGSVVYFGNFLTADKIEVEVAVKRFLSNSLKKDSITSFNKKFADLEHKYLLRYFTTENFEDFFVFIVTELCTGTLDELVKGRYRGPPIGDIDEKVILFQVSKGLEHLHNKNIVHGDIKPSNILIFFPSPANDGNAGDPSSPVLFKLADYGIYSIIEFDDASSYKKQKKSHLNLFGTLGWRAPELHYSDTFGFPADIFALGCIFGYTLSGGKHPYGECTLEQSIQIMQKKGMKMTKNDLKLQFSDHDDSIFDLIKSMLSMDPEKRPRIEEVLSNYFFSNQEQAALLPISEIREVQLMKESISYDQRKIIHQDFPRGHIVFSGLMSTNRVAINRITTKEIDLETDAIMTTNSLRYISNINPFVIRFLDMGSIPKFYKFIVTELWEATLEDYVEGHYKGLRFKDDREILLAITNGLHYFHCEMKAAHGNIRPKTILICPSSESVTVKLADTVTSACNQEYESLMRSVNNGRTFRWRGYAESLLPSEDILPLGFVFAYALGIGGKSYFDDDIYVKIQIATRRKLTNSEKSKDDGTILLALIQSMVNRDPKKRPTAAELLNHAFFLEYKNSLGACASDELEVKEVNEIDDSVSQSLKDLKLKSPITASEEGGNSRERREVDNITKITYERKYRLGCSAYGAVFLGMFNNNKKVAVKRIGKYDGWTGEEEDAFKMLNHPNIIKLIETEDRANLRLYAFEFCDASLDQVFLHEDDPNKYQGPQLPGHSTVLLQLSEGLAHIHSKNLVHGGIKPENVLISFSGMKNDIIVLKWSDFGLNTYVNENETYEMSYTRGTLFWMSPELLEHLYERKGSMNTCRKRCTQTDDIFSAGCLFFKIVTGVHPFGDDIFTDVIPNIRSNNPINFLNSDNVLPLTHFAYDSVAGMLGQKDHASYTMKDVVGFIRKEEMQNSKEGMVVGVGEPFAGSADESTLVQTASKMQQSGVIQQRMQEIESKEVGSTVVEFEKEKDTEIVVGAFKYKLSDRIESGNHQNPHSQPSSKTLVFKGFKNGYKPIALKRYKKIDGSASTETKKDLEVLSWLKNKHPGFVCYHGDEEDKHFKYIATELCECSVADIIDPKRKDKARQKTPFFDTIVERLSHKEILRQSSEAVRLLHSLDLIHRNTHPDNFLISCEGPKKDVFLIKLTDFKLSKRIKTQNPENTVAYNKEGWVAPESFKENIELDNKIDAFILGCYYFYVLSRGNHPFGKTVTDMTTRIQNENDAVYQDSWDGKPEWDIDSTHIEEENMKLEIVKDVVKFDRKDRKCIDDVLKNEYFQADGSRDFPSSSIASQNKFVDVKIISQNQKIAHPFGDDPDKILVLTKDEQPMLMVQQNLNKPYCDDDISAFESIQSMPEVESFRRPSSIETAKVATSVLKKVDDHLSYYFSNSKEHLLGEGGFAFVFLGLWRDPLGGNEAKEKKVAVKRIQRDPIQQSNFQKEVDHFLKVKGHPNILQCFATKMDDSFLYIVTELCNGTLKMWMEGKYQGPPIGDEKNILFQITTGLAYLHDNGIIHRDIKPSNILISIPEVEGGEPLMKLADFGISGVLIKEKGFTNADKHSSLGTKGYMAPEMYQSNRYDFKVDIYALGVVFGQVLSKERKNPFDSTIRAEGSMMILELDDFKLPYSNDGHAFELIKSMGNVKPEKRPTAQEILEHIFCRPLNFNVAHAASIKEPMDSNFGK